MYRQLYDQLDFGPYFGWNPDALFDRLDKDVPRPLTIVWRESRVSRSRMGRKSFARMVRVLQAVVDSDLACDTEDPFTYELR